MSKKDQGGQLWVHCMKRKEREATTAVTSYGTSSSLQVGKMDKVGTEGKARRNYGRLLSK